jgi:hypothetical protein
MFTHLTSWNLTVLWSPWHDKNQRPHDAYVMNSSSMIKLMMIIEFMQAAQLVVSPLTCFNVKKIG